MCGSCHLRWHTSCAKVSVSQSRQLPIWHCPTCLGRAPTAKATTPKLPTIPECGIPEGLANLKSRTKLVARIPKGVRPVVADALCSALEEALKHPTSQAWWSFLSFSFHALRAPSAHGPKITAAACIRQQLVGSDGPVSQGAPLSDAPLPAESTHDATARRVRGKCADGDIRAALRILTSDDTFAEPGEEVIAALRSKHPPAPDDENMPSPPSSGDPAPLTVTAEQVEAAIVAMPTGSSGGLDGIRPIHLRQLVSREAAESGRRLLTALTALTNTFLAGQLPECGRDALYGASLCALRKKSGGLRPIAVGSVYRRLAARIGARHMSSLLGAELRPVQLGVGTRLGCEAAVHATRRFIEANSGTDAPQVLVKVDVSNAFNTVRRDVFLNRIRERCPEIFPLAYQGYSAPTPLYIGNRTITSSTGVQQGDPLGPAAFSLAIDQCARAMTSPLNIWYLDDATLAGPAETVATDLLTLRSSLSSVGLSLNASKCEVAFLGSPTSPLHGPALDAITNTLTDIRETQLPDLTLLGAPLTDGGLTVAVGTASATVERLCSRLRHLDSHTAIFFLAHYVSAPRLSYLLRSAPVYKEPHTLNCVDEVVRGTLEAVSNVSLSDVSWEQATLPIRLGGLGVRSVERLALPCYIASSHASLPLTRSICPYLSDSTLPHTLLSAIHLFAERTGLNDQQLPSGDSSGCQRSWDTLSATVSRDHLLSQANHVHRARLLAASQPHTAAWIQAAPVPSLGLHLDDEVVRVAVALRLGAPICEPHRCYHCDHPVDQLGHHGLSCIKSAGRLPRHSLLNDVVRRSLASAGFPAILEPVGLDRGDGKRPDGLTVFPFQDGKCLTWDATCADTFAETVVIESALEPGAAARLAEARKQKRYASLTDRYSFVPVAVETTGVLGPAAATLVQDLGRRISARTGERRETAWLRQRLSMAVVRGNAASVLATAQQPTRVPQRHQAPAAAVPKPAPHNTSTPPSAPALPTARQSPTAPTPADARPPLQPATAGHRGLANLGNTCYMNAVLQALFLSDEFCSTVLRSLPQQRCPLLRRLQRCFAFLAMSRRPFISLATLDLAPQLPAFERGRQHDGDEYLNALLTSLHEEELGASETSTQSSHDPSASLVRRFFGGQTEVRYTCRACGFTSIRHDEGITSLHLAVPESSLQSRQQVQVADLVDAHLLTEPLTGDRQYRCEPCGKLCDAGRQLHFVTLPRQLIVTLVRFAYNRTTGMRRKILTSIDLSERLQVQTTEDGVATFRLYAVLIHSGRSPDAGHYYCVARHSGQPSGSWLRLDDAKVAPLPAEASAAILRGGPTHNRERSAQLDTPYTLLYQLDCGGAETTAPATPPPRDFPKTLLNEVDADNEKFLRLADGEGTT